MQSAALILSEVLLIPYIAWGIHLLIRKYRYHEDEPILVEAATLGFVVLFCVLQVALLRTYLRDDLISLVFAVLGLMVSVAALYGHVMISVASRGIVDLMTPDPNNARDVPRLGPAEALERCGDFESALQECLVLARIYPMDPTVQMHIAENMRRLSRLEESAVWFERASKNTANQDSRLNLAIRAVEVLHQELQQTADAVAVLERYTADPVNAPHAEHVRQHIEGLLRPAVSETHTVSGLESLYETPIDDAEDMVMPAVTRSFLSIEEVDVELGPGPQGGASGENQMMTLESLETVEVEVEVEEEGTQPQESTSTSLSLSLEPMDDAPLEIPPAPKRQSGIRRKAN